MIWQENITIIVMLTNIFEHGKNKCTQYWPENDKVLDVGPCKMKLLEETVYAFYTRRVLSVMEKNCKKRTITQFHYTAWPDHGTPEELELVQFHRAEQYIFLHEALLCGFHRKDTVIEVNDIHAKFEPLLHDNLPLNQRNLYKEYKFLQTLKPLYDDKDKEDGMERENIEKNSFTDSNAFILTQYPLKDTEVDLWRLCMDHDVQAIVILSDNNQTTSWIPQKDLPKILEVAPEVFPRKL
uniref:protein-tyrosine-phosphatase n=1 Tax=Crassostrea virginica TaxID=6565 RepID=A0A8B8BWI5_CRAVI|nr:receptor-type tyrosine-protein phosphatase zeta-like [Crassostrea virginica]